jgi:uncharacterized membrane protein (UPF0127 family)
VPHFLEPLLKSTSGLTLCIEGQASPLATTVETAFDSASRRKGLLGRAALPDDTALVIAPCSAVHTFAMRFAIDVIFARRDGRIVKLRRAMPAARVSAAPSAFAVIEMSAGSIDRSNLQVGDRLVVG